MDTDVEFFTLNCWGIPYVSKNRKERMEAIADHLCNSHYDVVCLQEVWSKDDFNLIKETSKNSLPHAHYFHSGVVGSGVCILSKFPMEDVFFHQWSVNGYIHKIQHGDWFGGKGVGFVRLRYNNMNIHVYSAHLHAEYDRQKDEYMAHRVLQAYDTAQFIRLTSAEAHLIVLAGDLNTEPGDLAYRLLLNESGLQDAFTLSSEPLELCGTNEGIRNSYTPKNVSKKAPVGKRIDYILFKSNTNNVKMLKYGFPLPERVPEKSFSYSDHEAISAKLKIIENSKENSCSTVTTNQIPSLKESVVICNDAINHLKRSRLWCLITASLLFVLLLGAAVFTIISEYRIILLILQVIGVIIIFCLLLMGTLWHQIETNAIYAGMLAMKIRLDQVTGVNSSKDMNTGGDSVSK